MQMLFRTMLIDALHAALENREKAFDGVRMHVAIRKANVLAGFVVNPIMLGKGQRQRVVAGTIRQHARFLGDVSPQDRGNRGSAQIVDDHAARTAGRAVNQRQDLMLLRRAALGLRLTLVGADKGFVGFDAAATLTERRKISRAHGFADAMPKEPRTLERAAESAMQLIRADPLLAGRDQENRLQPEPQRNVTRLEDRPDLDRKRLPTVVALVRPNPRALTGHQADALNATAVRADWTARPHARFDEAVGSFFVVKVRGGKYRITHMFSLCKNSIGRYLGYVKYNIAKLGANIYLTNAGSNGRSRP